MGLITPLEEFEPADMIGTLACVVIGGYASPALRLVGEPGRRRARQTLRAGAQRWASGDVYLNLIGDEGRSRVIAGFSREHYRRLAQIKRTYDPDTVFRLNHAQEVWDRSARRGER